MEEVGKSASEQKVLYAFGDSLIAGHTYPRSFVDFAADRNGFQLQKFAINGATVMEIPSIGGRVIEQVANAPEKAPDLVIFDGGTNDAEYLGRYPNEFAVFEKDFQQLLFLLKKRWPHAELIYLQPHKMGSREMTIQERLQQFTKEICEKNDIRLLDLFSGGQMDTREFAAKNAYTFDSNDQLGLPGKNGSGTHPNLAAIEEFYLPALQELLAEPN